MQRRMTPEHVNQLVELAGVLHDEAEACSRNKLWRAAAFLVAQSVEAALVATVSCCEPELRSQHAWPAGKDGRDLGPPEDWTFGVLLGVAKRAGWLVPSLPKDTTPIESLGGEVGDAVRFLLEARNLAAHPGRAIVGGDLLGHDFTDDHLVAQIYPVLDGIAGAVFERLKEVLLELP